MRIYGKNPVLERLKSNPKSIRLIYVESGNSEHGYIASKARKHGIPINVVNSSKMLKLARNLNTQGLMMDVEDFAYANYDDILETAEKEKLTLLFLDNISDPQNLGVIIRNTACLGGFVIVIPTKNSVSVTDTVLRIACGGENYVHIAKVTNLNQAIEKAKKQGFWIAGTVVKDGEDIRTTTLPFPLGIVVGCEAKGIRDVVQTRLDIRLNIPMAHPRLSLNAANAAGMFCYEISRQRLGAMKEK